MKSSKWIWGLLAVALVLICAPSAFSIDLSKGVGQVVNVRKLIVVGMPRYEIDVRVVDGTKHCLTTTATLQGDAIKLFESDRRTAVLKLYRDAFIRLILTVAHGETTDLCKLSKDLKPGDNDLMGYDEVVAFNISQQAAQVK